jgi:serine/threonine protein kinase
LKAQADRERPLASRRDYTPGDLVPGTIYRILGKIASGGMGAVYDVEDTSVGKRYVLKALHPDLCDRKDLTRRMQAEARALGRLAHPNIVEVVTAGATAEDPPRPFFVMERLEGQSLRTVLDAKGRLELPHAYGIALDLLAALEHAHAHGVVHRDVKPDNLFLHRTRGVTTTKLLDFGIMRIVGRNGETAGRFVGTWRYAAPEQLRGENATPETDVYAAGLVLFEMVAGCGPFDEVGDEKQVASAHLKREAPRLSTRLAVPPALDALVAASLAKDRSRRPRSALSFAASLRNIAMDASASVAPAATSLRITEEDLEPRARRQRTLGLVAMGGLAAVCAGAVLALRASSPSASSSPPGTAAAGAGTATSAPMVVRSAAVALPASVRVPPPPDAVPSAVPSPKAGRSVHRAVSPRPTRTVTAPAPTPQTTTTEVTPSPAQRRPASGL